MALLASFLLAHTYRYEEQKNIVLVNVQHESPLAISQYFSFVVFLAVVQRAEIVNFSSHVLFMNYHVKVAGNRTFF